MTEGGHPVTPALVVCLSPYTREHIRRFGQGVLDMEDGRSMGPMRFAHLCKELGLDPVAVQTME